MKSRVLKLEACIIVEAPVKIVNVLCAALKPEVESELSSRSAVTIESSQEGIVIKITAEDTVSLRAALNSYLYWMKGILDIGSII